MNNTLLNLVSWLAENCQGSRRDGRIIAYLLQCVSIIDIRHIILSEHPYKDEIVPSLGAAIAYTGDNIPPTVQVLAHDMSVTGKCTYAEACNVLRQAQHSLRDGVMLLNANPLGFPPEYDGLVFEAQVKVANAIRSIILRGGSAQITLICLGSSASAIGTHVRSSLKDVGGVKLVCDKNPVYYARQAGGLIEGQMMKNTRVASSIRKAFMIDA